LDLASRRSGIVTEKGQVIRINCKRCGVVMAKWERRPQELETIYPYPFDKVCGHCLTKQEVDFYKKTGGLIMAHEKEISGVFRYNAESKRFMKFIFEADGGVVGNIFVPKDAVEIPGTIILTLSQE
jgi:hypothetical protein